MRVRGLAVSLLLAGGCAFEAGVPFAVVEPVFVARYGAAPARDAGEGFHKLASDYQVVLTRAEMTVGTLGLLSVGGGAGRFDPADPPPGYGLCHGGHCHSDDGRLVSYEEIEAQLGGGGMTTVLVMPVGEVDLLAGQARALACEGGCELPLGGADRLEVRVERLVLEGRVRDGRAAARVAERGFRVELGAGDVAVLGKSIELDADRKAAPRVALEVSVELGPGLFDAIDWAALTADEGEGLDLAAPGNEAALEAIRHDLAEAEVRVQVERGEL
jgi:hypothetical protein